MTHIATTRPRRIWITLLALCAALSFGAAVSTAGTIVDNAQIFSSNAVSQAQQTIDRIQALHHKDFNVETFASVPADQQNALETQGRDAFFNSWAIQRAKAMGTNGVYLLVCMDPRIVKVAVGNSTATREFTNADKEGLRSVLIPPFKAKDFDGGLIKGAQYVSDRMDTNTRVNAGSVGSAGNVGPGVPFAPVGSAGTLPINRPAGSFMGSWLCVGVAIVLLLVIFRARGGGGGGFNYGGPSQGFGYGGNPGGGFGSGLLGGILGGALGSWGYDRFNRNSGGSDFTGNNMGNNMNMPPSGGSDFSAPSAPDTDFTTSSGGDFSGGGDSGGGGGDSSGGSSGGDF